MKRVAIVHPLFNVVGGAEKLALDMARVLESHGWSVNIYTLEVDRRAIEKIMHGSLHGYRIRVLDEPLWLRVVRAALRGSAWRLQRILIYDFFWKYIKILKNSYNVIIETQSNMPSPADISYLHEPGFLLNRAKGVYGSVLSLAERALLRHGRPRLVLTNSKWTQMLLRKTYGVHAEVLHPAVDVEFFSSCDTDGRERLVATVTRFEPQKRAEKIIYLAKLVRGYQFVIIGSAQGDRAWRYVDKIRRKARELGIGDKIVLIPNASRETLRDTLCRARFYLHPPYPEYFGIAVAEAMAAGAVPIVYRMGGAWTDLVAPVSTRLGYVTLREAAEIIMNIDSRLDSWLELSRRARRLAAKLDIKTFSKKLIEIVESVSN